MFPKQATEVVAGASASCGDEEHSILKPIHLQGEDIEVNLSDFVYEPLHRLASGTKLCIWEPGTEGCRQIQEWQRMLCPPGKQLPDQVPWV